MGRVQSKESYFVIINTFFAFFFVLFLFMLFFVFFVFLLLFIKKLVCLSFSFLFLMKHQISATEY